MKDLALQTFASELSTIPYRKYLGAILGSPLAAILLQQMIYNASRSKKPGVFYKFKKPTEHRYYKVGDSWLEELCVSEGKYDGAFGRIGVSAKNASEVPQLLKEDLNNHAIVSYQDGNNVTWFYINKKVVMRLLEEAYELELADYKRCNEEEDEPIDPVTAEFGESSGKQKVVEREAKFASPEYKGNNNNNIIEYFNKRFSEPDGVSSYFENGNGGLKSKKVKKIRKATEKQEDFLKAQANGYNLSVDFSINSDIMDTLVGLGYDRRDVQEELIKFKFYYTKGNGAKFKSFDWTHRFVYEWLDRSYKNGYLLRNGKFYGDSEGKRSRAETIRDLSRDDLFDDVLYGTTEE